jgi:hypothetical protein
MTRNMPKPAIDRVTVGAIAIVAYALANLLHEAVGHGGACLLVGGRPQMLNGVFCQCDQTTLSPVGIRVVAAGGTIVNLIVAGGLLAWMRAASGSSPRVRYFCWLLMALNTLTAFGYLLFSGIGGFGDWAEVINRLPGQALLRIAEAVLGGALYFVIAPRVLWRTLLPFLGDGTERVRRAGALTVLPYWLGGTLYVTAGLFNPEGIKLVLLSAAAASFGGTSLLAWFFTMRARQTAASPAGTELSGVPAALPIGRSLGWIVAALVAAAIFVGLLGPGITL